MSQDKSVLARFTSDPWTLVYDVTVYSAWLAIQILILPLAIQSLEVKGTIFCPSASDVRERLRPLLTSEASVPATDWLELYDVPSRTPGIQDLEVRLARTGTGRPLGVRRVERKESCAETADVVAVITASWIASYPTPVLGVPSFPDLTPPASIGPIVGLPSSATVSDASSSVGQALDLKNETVRVSAASGRKSPRELAVGAAAGIVSGMSGGSAPEVQIEGEIDSRRWVLRLAAVGNGTRDVAFGMGRATWRRLTIFPTVTSAWHSSNGFMEVGGGPLIAATQARGTGFTSDGSDTGLDLGIGPSLRVGRRLAGSRSAIWVGVRSAFWLRPHRAAVDGLADGQPPSVALPWWDVSAAAGITFPIGI